MIEASLKDLAVARVGFVVRVRAVVHREGSLIEVALKFEAGLVDELFILRLAIGDGLLAEVGQQPHRFEIDIEHRVRIRQKAGDFRRSAFSQPQGGGNRHDDENNGEDRPRACSCDFAWSRS